MTSHPPGLIKREIVHQDASTVTIRETWDLKVPGCPWVAFDRATFEIADNVTGCVHEYYVPTHVAKAKGLVEESDDGLIRAYDPAEPYIDPRRRE